MKFTGLLGVARAPMQLDVGFGDAVVPSPVDIEVPPLLDFPAPKLRGYQRDTSIAEKFHAMVVLGTGWRALHSATAVKDMSPQGSTPVLEAGTAAARRGCSTNSGLRVLLADFHPW